MEAKEETVNDKDPLLIPATASHKHGCCGSGPCDGHQCHHHSGRSLLLLPAIILVVLICLESSSLAGSGRRYPAPARAKKVAGGKCFPRDDENLLIPVHGSGTNLVASYAERRSSPRQIRTVAIVNRMEHVNYACTFCCGNGNADDAFQVSSATYDVHSDHFGFRYGTADILCPVPKNCSDPSHVAIHKQYHPPAHHQPSNGPSTSPSTNPTKVALPQNATFLPIRNNNRRDESHGPFRHQFTICISVMYEYSNVLQLVQTLEMFKLLGADHVAIYRSSCDEAARRVLEHYEAAGFVEVVPWPITERNLTVSRGWQPSDSPGDLHYFGQTAALNDCVYRFMYQSRYVVMQDLDELIVPLQVDTWPELLPRLEQQHGTGVASFEFENNVFRNTQCGRNAAQRPDEWAGVPGVDVLDHVWREPNDPHAFNNIKTIVNPRAVYRATVHGVLWAEGASVRVDRELARLYHVRGPYRRDVANEELVLDERLWHYAPRLVPAVTEVIKRILKSK
ncbi:uncharacterized protein si:zfos-464b6.2 isoform X1 [Engraulis encrasicolus]|uniref:uncharacterized protein si:zfos-464b6.2 isoform X1 n=1 Tax=Engraulis encrasicolus TaxID=184585 RepID=UPI002FD37A82